MTHYLPVIYPEEIQTALLLRCPASKSGIADHGDTDGKCMVTEEDRQNYFHALNVDMRIHLPRISALIVVRT